MMSDGIHSRGTTQAVNVDNFAACGLTEVVLHEHCPESSSCAIYGYSLSLILIQDSARPQTTRETMDFLDVHNIPLLSCPAQSHDFNPI